MTGVQIFSKLRYDMSVLDILLNFYVKFLAFVYSFPFEFEYSSFDIRIYHTEVRIRLK